MKYFFLGLFFLLYSCSSMRYSLIDDIDDYIMKISEEEYIPVNIRNIKQIGEPSKYHVSINNDTMETIYIFSVVLENSLMFYSKKNQKHIKNTLIYNSYYKYYMKDALHSGVKDFTFIPIKKQDSLVINLLPKKIDDSIEKIELIYYYYSNLTNDESFTLLANVQNKQLKMDKVTSVIR